MTNQATNIRGKVCLVTGATSGIGEVTARELAKMGAKVVLTARTQRKADLAIERIRAASGRDEISGLVADLSSQAEIRSLAEEFFKRYERLDVLINNAGAVYLRRTLSADGIEMNFAANHLAYFLLTNLLLDQLIASTPSRIINVSSSGHAGKELDFDDLECRHNYKFMQAYGKSKLANLLFTYELDRCLSGTDVTVNALHPGLVATNIGGNNGWLVRMFLPLLRLWAIDVEEGAETSIFLAASPDVEGVSGQYFYKKRAIRSSPYSYDIAAAGRLWQISAEMTGIDGSS